MKLRAETRELQPFLEQSRRQVHQYPELGFEEYETAEFIDKQLTEWGVEHHTGIAKTGIVATIGGTSPKPVLAIRGDIDTCRFKKKTRSLIAQSARALSLLNLGSLVILMVSCIPPANAQLFLVQGEIEAFDTNSRCVETVRKVLIKEGFDRYAKRNNEGNASTWSVEISTGGSIIIVCAEKTAAMGAINLDPNADSSVMDTYQLLKNELLDEASQGKAPLPLVPPSPSIPPIPD